MPPCVETDLRLLTSDRHARYHFAKARGSARWLCPVGASPQRKSALVLTSASSGLSSEKARARQFAAARPVLDRYISGEDVPFTEVRKVWRNTTQPMCGLSGFFEQFFPLVRALNQKLPPEKRIRVLAGDPPIDWEQVKTSQELDKSMMNREASITSVMEKEVLSKHRKALMLFGTMHLMHAMSAVSTYERAIQKISIVGKCGSAAARSIKSPCHHSTRAGGAAIPFSVVSNGINPLRRSLVMVRVATYQHLVPW